MTTKQAIIASVISIVLVLVIGLGLAFLFIPLNSPGAEERFGMLGGAIGFLAVIPSGFIWGKWAMARRQEQEKPKKKSRRA